MNIIDNITFSYFVLIFISSLLAILLNLIFTRPIVHCLWEKMYKVQKDNKTIPDHLTHKAIQPFVTVLGLLECSIYSASILIGLPQAIAFVITLKLTPQLKVWSENKDFGRPTFNIWLIGNLLNVILSFLVAMIAKITWVNLDC
ncbi:MAG: hypothetical protein JXA42_27125 [Anaerolineales bacterium]|nr:hypothetical protein [Anaerolineales bacterium]